MRKITFLLLCSLLLSGCASIPPESVQLSATLGNDLQSLHKSHRAFVILHYGKMKEQINQFVDDVYAPYAISQSLKIEMEEFNVGNESLPGLIKEASEGNNVATKEVLLYMQDFLEITNEEIEAMRMELLQPVRQQERELLIKVDNAYSNAIQANATLTAHLKSIRKVKESQAEALQLIGLNNVHETITEYALKASGIVDEATQTAKKVDATSDEVLEKVDEIKEKLQTIKNK
ncbi:MAG: hypothetical protein N4A74_15280 [Carboxylicivirga sp.]|jgi:hypothetical protein|nr:hypothetical protein [Carboxylicivirga sp.]